MYDYIIVGAGFAGSVIAEQASRDGKKVLIIDSRNHIAGNMYDFVNEEGILVHKYGPHIFHTSEGIAADYLIKYSQTFKYEHRVRGFVDGSFVPIPFNITSLKSIFSEKKSQSLIEELTTEYGMDVKVPILELKKSNNPDIVTLAEFVYDRIFKHYTMKQWDLLPEEIDPAVTKRVPVSISFDDRYFQDDFQEMPTFGFTKMFDKMLTHKNIELQLGINSKEILSLKNGEIFFKGEKFNGELVFTGSVDELFDFQCGELPYRSLEFLWETHAMDSYQECATVNYPTPATQHPYTRITEFKKFTMEDAPENVTTIIKEIPYNFQRDAEKGNTPYYPVFTESNQAAYKQYEKLSSQYPQLHLLGRLAEYKYYNMDTIIVRALEYYKAHFK